MFALGKYKIIILWFYIIMTMKFLGAGFLF